MSFQSRFGSIASINWFPGHMATAKKQIQAQLAQVDVVIEVRDARLPFSSANPVLDELCRPKSKPRLVVFNKADLSNSNLQQRVKKNLFDDYGAHSLFTTATKTKHLGKVIEWCRTQSTSQFKQTGGTIILIIGIPNVGKSSLINQLKRLDTTYKGRPRAAVGNTPGLTRRTDMIRINDRPALYVVDTPGVMIPKLESVQLGLKLALTGAIKDTIVGHEVLADYMLYSLNRIKSDRYVDVLGLEGPTDTIQVLFDQVTSKSGGIGKEPRIQRELAAKYLLSLFRDGKLGQFTLDHV